MIHDDLPRSYLLIQCKNELNKMVEIERLPGNVPGAMINLNSEIEKLLERHTVKHSDVNDIKIKFSGDGTKVSRISNFVIFSISNMSINGSLSFQEQHTFAIVECSETYDNLKKCCKPIFDQFNSVLSKRKWHIGEKTLNVEYFVSADMKFIQLLLGLCGATGEYACPWCKVNKEGRSDLTRPWDYYHNPSIGRNIEDMLDSNFKKSYGCKHMPLISLPVNHYVPDELHLMLRITDVLLRNLIDDALEMDDDSKMRRIIPINLKKLTELLQSCGVSFHMWHNKAGEIEWTSLSGTEKVKLLNHLPSKLASEDGVIFENSKHSVIKLWEDFYVLYKYVNDTTDSGEVIFEKAKLWLENFLNIGKLCRKGYNLHNVTPYMHCLVYHVPFLCFTFWTIKDVFWTRIRKK
ncbi:unnamed protein product [Mytilus edulis]|uniref:Uncharacterized protein n=1 Tax=Mytilus edulis TaxID=6550 RepID=A0A8S3Q595_MYTED|nr:unnamed protein product [Mytilus edulis]